MIIVKKIIVLLFLLISLSGWSQSDSLEIEDDVEQEEIHDFNSSNDSTIIDKRSFNNTTIDELRNDPQLQYKQPPTVAESLWDRLKQWLYQLLRALFEGATLTDIGRILIYTAGLVLLILIILTLLKVNAFRVFFSRADENKIEYKVFHENIHEMDFEKLIREASERKDFRLGTRLILLYALKLLSDKHLIQWEAGKTNHDYVNEINTPELKTGLNEISFYFDYAWYGNFSVPPETFQKIQNTFADWRLKLK